MTRNVLSIFLPGFAVVFFFLLAFWSYFRRRRMEPVGEGRAPDVKVLDALLTVMVLAAMTVILVYSFFPEGYSFFAPIDILDHPIINTVGVLVLKLSLVWIILAQLLIDKSLHMMRERIYEKLYTRLFIRSQKMLRSGIVIMLAGLFISISSIATVTLCIAGLLLLNKYLRVT